ncbi:NmrA-like protein [Colletotrichum karsti]|uniref:NmrA-like protein n=1 Tax=Colletotrichum karsti TaxID=1095194 RepID=A0A9P6IB29_9PEZI|nr:NmrA-like protein [Colletotrichum karsti]KAF9878516.1 NmrA-like protein [Colletotrichum karsti]
MVQVTVAGGVSSIARVVIDAILEKKKHRVTSLTSQEVDSVDENGIHWKHADYDNKSDLVNILRGTDVLLCFFSARDTATVARRQKNLIDAAVEAGVRRFAPAEYAGRNYNGMAMFEFKDDVLEYSLFQTGIFTNEFAYPHKTATHFEPLRMYVDFEARRAIQPGAGDHTITLTTVEDIAAVVAEAVEFEGEWPRVGGICGSRLTVNELIRLGESVRGPFVVETVDEEAVEAGRLTTSWYPLIEHAGVPEGRKEELSKLASLNFLKATINGSWNVSEEWNNLLPHIQFTDARRYLAQVWEDKL